MKDNSNKSKEIPVIILAAGLSSRMGVLKPFLKWDKQTTFLEKIILEYKLNSINEIVVVLNNEGYKQIKNEIPGIVNSINIIINETPEKGRMSSLKLGLKNLSMPTSCFIQNVDNPFVTKELLNTMNIITEPDTYIVPVYQGKGGHPILLGKEIINNISLIDDSISDLRILLKNFKRIEVETNDKNILVNINTLSDYQKYFEY